MVIGLNQIMNYSYVNSYTNTLEKAVLNVFVHHIEEFSKLEIQIYNSEVLEMAGRKARRKAQMIAKRYAFPTKASRYTNIIVTKMFSAIKYLKFLCT